MPGKYSDPMEAIRAMHQERRDRFRTYFDPPSPNVGPVTTSDAIQAAIELGAQMERNRAAKQTAAEKEPTGEDRLKAALKGAANRGHYTVPLNGDALLNKARRNLRSTDYDG